MPSQPLDRLLDHIPKKTPIWAIGVVTILACVVTSAIIFGIVFREDIKETLNWAEKHHVDTDIIDFQIYEKEVAVKNKHYDDVLTAILGLVTTNSSNIVEVSKQVGLTQQQNIILTDRVTTLEKEVSLLRSNLQECEIKLTSCMQKNR